MLAVGIAAAIALQASVSQGLGAQQARSETVRASTPAGGVEVPVARHRGFGAVSVAELLGGFLDDAFRSGSSVRAVLAGRALILQTGSPFLRYGERTYQLANAPYESEGQFWVPSEMLTDWWPRVEGRPDPPVARAPAASTPPGRRDGVFRVIIDPGHGGKDPGTSGRSGTREKDVVLAIARELKRQLEDVPGVDPVLTRDRDEFIGLKQRSSFAVAQGGDLFLSIHANWARDRRAAGFETFFLSTAKTEEARGVAVRENASAQYEEGTSYAEMSDLDFILAGIDRNENVQESRRVAGFAQNSLRTVRRSPDRGVKQAGFWVLVGASGSMPAVICEVGFLSNPDEERVLRSPEGQREIARSLADGVLRYRSYLEEVYERVVSESSSPR